MSQLSRYEHSGEFSIVSLVPAAGLGAAVALGVGWVYAYAIYYIPFIYINAILAAGFGFAVAYISAYALRFGRVRNTTVFSAGMLLIAGIGFLAHWGAWVAIVVRASGYEASSWAVMTQPLAMWETILAINEVGVWSLFGTDVSGVALWAVWAVEAGIIFGVGFVVSHGEFHALPFCERCETWCKKSANVARLWHTDPQAVVDAFDQGDLGALDSFEIVDRDLTQGSWLECEIDSCGDCGGTHTLDVSLVHAVPDEGGKVSRDATPVLTNLLLSQQQADEIRSLGVARVGA